jgi:hypothetical protein
MTGNKITKKKINKKCNAENKKKKYRTFPAHMGVQPITSIISSLKFDTPMEGCSAILCSLIACFKNFS